MSTAINFGNAYADACVIEREQNPDMVTALQTYLDVVFTPVRDRARQMDYGDYYWEDEKGRIRYMDMKADTIVSPNLFIEDMSNEDTKRKGWFHSLNADSFIAYGRTAPSLRMIHVLRLPELREFMPTQEWTHVEQDKYQQSNITTGWLVPIKKLLKECPRAVSRTLCYRKPSEPVLMSMEQVNRRVAEARASRPAKF